MQKLKEKLKPCPFCGGKARMTEYSPTTSATYTGYAIGCTNLNCFMSDRKPVYRLDREVITKAWNTRE